MAAAHNGHLPTVQELLTRRANVDARNKVMRGNGALNLNTTPTVTLTLFLDVTLILIILLALTLTLNLSVTRTL